MLRAFLFAFLFLFAGIGVSSAQDSLVANGKHYMFIPGMTDTVKGNGSTYIIKYVEEPEMGDFLRSNGKIYVVVTVLATIFAGIFAYLVYLNRKISKLEKENK